MKDLALCIGMKVMVTNIMVTNIIETDLDITKGARPTNPPLTEMKECQ